EGGGCFVKRSLGGLLTLGAAGAAPAQQEESLVTRLVVRPAKEPVPALRYHLLPELRERTPGNAALLYYRAYSPEWLTHMRPEVAKKLDEWSMKPGKVPPAEFRWVLTYNALKELDLAARREYCEWEMTPRVRKEGIGLLMPDVQGYRGFARVLYLRARFQIADGKHDDVAHTLQTGLALARDISNAPTLVQSLVGNAIAALALNEVEHWVQSPGCPNLYWALTNLPRPFIDLRKPLQGERLWVESLFPGVRDLIDSPTKRILSADEVQKMLVPLAGLTSELGVKLSDAESRLALAAMAARAHPAAKRTLLARGWTARQVEAMPVMQAFILYEIQEYDRIYDEMLKWSGLPYPQAKAGVDRANRRFEKERNGGSLGG